jgi:folate-dependent phosphoribosylglycinamide formyltransferase PurN
MRLLTMSHLEHYSMQVINLYLTLPGTFPGTHAIERTIQVFQNSDIEHTGVMGHFVKIETQRKKGAGKFCIIFLCGLCFLNGLN